MKRIPLTALVFVLIAGALVAWFADPSRHFDWIPLFVMGLVLWAVSLRIADLEKQLAKLEGPAKP